MPQIIPPSPKASAFMKFGDYPVSLYTGLVDITIPIYTIDVKGVKVPIEFKYHASGIRYDDVSLEVGLGWSLNAGDTINYTARGGIRSFSGGVTSLVKNASAVNPTGNGQDYNDNYYMGKMVETGERTYTPGDADGETDIYTYSFLHFNGKFGYTADGTTFSIPKCPLTLSASSSENISMTDEKGVTYLFKQNYVEAAYNRRQICYYLTKIIFASDTISFNYTEYDPVVANVITRPYIDQVAVYEEREYDFFSSFLNLTATRTGGIQSVNYYPFRLNNITFRGGRVDFVYNANATTGALKRDLRIIKVYNNIQTAPIQTINLTKSAFLQSRGDRLDQVTFSNSQGDTYSYQFGYNGHPGSISSGIDYWGYNNGNSNSGYIPNIIPNANMVVTVNRAANEYAMQSGILNRITYPSKGYTTFTYEAHRANNNQIYGGLRIKEIVSFDSNEQFIEKKQYKYGVNESNNGIAAAYPTAEDFCQTSRILQQYTDEFYIAPILGSVIKRQTYSAFPKRSYFTSGSSVVYTTVTEYLTNSSNEAYGKTVYNYTYHPEEIASTASNTARSGSIDMPTRNYEWENGLLISKKIYKKENNAYTEIYSLTNTYQNIFTAEYLNLRVLPFITVLGVSFNSGTMTPAFIMKYFDTSQCTEYQSWFSLPGYSSLRSPYNYFNYYTTTGLPVVTSSVVCQDGVTTTTNYYNYNSAGLPSKVSTVLSSGGTQTDSLQYASGLIFDQRGQIVSYPVTTKIRYQDNVFVEKEVTNFTQYSLFRAPTNVQYQSKTGNLETRITFDYDNKGNPKTAVKDEAEKFVYLWGYDNLYPIAKIENKSYSQITSIISAATLTAIANKHAPTEADWTTLKSSLSDAFVTFYKYKPLVGLIESIDLRGVETKYEYNDFGQLTKQIYNANVIEEYMYHYKP
jgi:YD repeat-containing protein